MDLPLVYHINKQETCSIHSCFKWSLNDDVPLQDERNRTFCPECQREKMAREEEQKIGQAQERLTMFLIRTASYHQK